jgi:hypothetical protein
MKQYLFGRVYRLELFYQSDVVFGGIGKELSYPVVREPAHIFENHRIQFTVTKSNKQDENTAEIVLTNAVNDIRKGAVVRLYTGYELSGGVQLLFIGDVINVSTVKDGADKSTILVCKEGSTLMREPISLSYGENTQLIEIIRDLTKKLLDSARATGVDYSDLGKESNNLSTVDSITAFDNGFSVNGRQVSWDDAVKSGFSAIGDPGEILSDICRTLGLFWTVQNSKFHFVPFEGTTRQEVVVLSSDSGLVGGIEQIEEKDNGVSGGVSGYKVQALLFPSILPGDPIVFGDYYSNGIDVTGMFRVDEIEHTGDTHGDRWNSNMKLSRVVTQ